MNESHKIDLVMLIKLTVVYKEALCKAEIREGEDSKGGTIRKAEGRTPLLAR